jgi:hypothetical protein
MNRMTATVTAALIVLAGGSATASNATYEYHADAAMRNANGVSVDKAYGYAYVVTDMKGHGVIRVMFSNGSPLHRARFNARIAFLDANGSVIREEHLHRRLEAAGAQGAVERRVSRLVKLTEFASVEVDFFLSDISEPVLAGVYQQAAYSGN